MWRHCWQSWCGTGMDNESKRRKVYRVFEKVAEGYDGGNVRISLGFQALWKRMLVGQVLRDYREGGRKEGIRLLDVCCGTGDIALAVAAKDPFAKVTGIDFSPRMLAVAKRKGTGHGNVTWCRGDALKLPFADAQFDAATISFGLRNTTDYERCLKEMQRVVRPGGYVYCLESCAVDAPLIAPFYRLYFHRIMPLLGGGVKRYGAYRWLTRSTEDFLRYGELKRLFGRTGLKKVRGRQRMFGACVLVTGQKGEKTHE